MTKNALVKIIESEKAKVKVYENGLVESFIRENVHLDVEFLRNGKQALEETGIKNFFVISEAEGFYRISKEARQLSASKEYSNHLKAVAVVTNHMAIRLIMELYFKLDKPVVPTKSFTERSSAMKWLKEMGLQCPRNTECSI